MLPTNKWHLPSPTNKWHLPFFLSFSLSQFLFFPPLLSPSSVLPSAALFSCLLYILSAVLFQHLHTFLLGAAAIQFLLCIAAEGRNVCCVLHYRMVQPIPACCCNACLNARLLHTFCSQLFKVLKKKYTQASDLWSLGVVVFMMVTGAVPFGGRDNDAIIQVGMQPSAPPFLLSTFGQGSYVFMYVWFYLCNL